MDPRQGGIQCVRASPGEAKLILSSCSLADFFEIFFLHRLSSLSQIILQARRTHTNTGSFSLDDIHIVMNRSCENIVPTTTPVPVTTTTSSPSSAMDCTFEQGDTQKQKSVESMCQ